MGASRAGGDYKDLTGYAAARRESLGPPPGFVMYGQTFIAEPVLRAAAMLDFVDGDGGEVRSLLRFLQDQLTPESWKRFDVMFRDRGTPVDDGMLDQAVGELMRLYTARPTKESSSSAPTPSKRGKSSKAGSSTKAQETRSA